MGWIGWTPVKHLNSGETAAAGDKSGAGRESRRAPSPRR